MSPSGSVEFLLTALRADTNLTDWLRDAQAADLDKIAVSAIVLGIAPLLHWQFSTRNLSLPPRADGKLLATRRASAVRQQAIESQLTEILDACARESIEPIVLKGAYLAACVYPERGLRPMNDIDILVRSEQLKTVETLLRHLGYIGYYKDAALGARVIKHTSAFRKPRGDGATPNPYLSAERERTVEPHVSLEESWYGLRADITPGVWERSVPIDVNGHTARALCATDLMLHLSIHLTFHLIMGWPSLVQLIDLLIVSGRLTPAEWVEVVRRARERNVSGFIYAALRLAQRALAAPIPESALTDLAKTTPSRIRAHAETLSLRNVMERTQKPPLHGLADRIRRGVRDRAETARWANTWREQLHIWRTLIDVAHTDTGRLIGERIKRLVVGSQ